MSQQNLIPVLIAAVSMFTTLIAGNPIAAAERHGVIARFEFSENVDKGLTAFIFVNGALEGAVPGTVMLPDQSKPTAVEIGIPRLGPNPVYSLALGPEQFANKSADLIVSHYEFKAASDESPTRDLSKDLSLQPNTKDKIAIQQTADGVFKFVLPVDAYRSVTAFVPKRAKPEGAFAMVKAVENNSEENGIDHMTYDTKTGKVVAMFDRGNATTWSGSYARDAYWGQGLPITHEDWTIVSNPDGALIITETGEQGSTTRKIAMPITGNPYLVLQKSGYADCSYQQCQKTQTSDGAMLTCTLAKLN